ncbi:MAG: YihY family inner membrane protein [Oligoflexus sp.]
MTEQVQLILRFAKVLREDFKRGQLLQHAYAMAYVTLLSLIPSLAVTFAVISLFTPFLGENSSLIQQAKGLILSHLAAGTGEQMIEQLDSFIANVDLKRIGFTGFIGTLVTLILLLRNVEAALNKIFEVEQDRPMLMRFIYFWTLLTLGTFLVALTVGTFSGFDFSGNTYGFLDLTENPIAGKIVYYVGIVIFFALCFKIIPNRFVGIRPAIAGAIVAAFLLSLAIQLFGIYTSVFRTYEAIYGAALSAIPVFLLWMYIVWLIILASATLTWRLHRGFRQIENGLSAAFNKGCTHQEYRLRADLPEMLIAYIFKSYQKGNFSGLNPEDVAITSSLPLHWVEEAIESLATAGLVRKVDDALTGELRVFPSFLPETDYTENCAQKLWSEYSQRVDGVLNELELSKQASLDVPANRYSSYQS